MTSGSNLRWPSDKPDEAKRSKRRGKGAVEIIDASLARIVEVRENGVIRKVPALELIFEQLLRKEMGGDTKAGSVRQQFEKMFRGKSEGQTVITEMFYADLTQLGESNDKAI